MKEDERSKTTSSKGAKGQHPGRIHNDSPSTLGMRSGSLGRQWSGRLSYSMSWKKGKPWRLSAWNDSQWPKKTSFKYRWLWWWSKVNPLMIHPPATISLDTVWSISQLLACKFVSLAVSFGLLNIIGIEATLYAWPLVASGDQTRNSIMTWAFSLLRLRDLRGTNAFDSSDGLHGPPTKPTWSWCLNCDMVRSK